MEMKSLNDKNTRGHNLIGIFFSFPEGGKIMMYFGLDDMLVLIKYLNH